MIPPTHIPQIVSDADATRLWKTRAGLDGFLSELRQRGAQKLESIRTLRLVSGMSLQQAKEAVHFSAAWSDRRAADDAVLEDLYRLAGELSEPKAEPSDRLRAG